MELNVPISLQKWQMEVINTSKRHTVICAGRQLGKSYYASIKCILKGLSTDNGFGWIISPSYRQSKIIFKQVVSLCKIYKIPVTVRMSSNQMQITFNTSGFELSAVSADDPDKLRGATLDLVVFDEAAMMKAEVWPEHIRPMTTVRKAECLFISTPKSKNWFYDIYTKEEPDWVSYHYTSYDSEFITADELDKIKKETDELTFQQEYMAVFLDNGGNVFTHFATAPISQTRVDGRVYVAGLDLARHTDFTVLTIMDMESCEIIDLIRFNNIDWEFQIEQIKFYCEKYRLSMIYADATGVGDAIVERLQREEGLPVSPIVFTGKSKAPIIQNLAVMLQQEVIKIPDTKASTDEFSRYEFNKTASGNTTYSAPAGYHDDIVCSIALVAWGITHTARDIGGYIEEAPQVESLWDTRSETDIWDTEPFDWEYSYGQEYK